MYPNHTNNDDQMFLPAVLDLPGPTSDTTDANHWTRSTGPGTTGNARGWLIWSWYVLQVFRALIWTTQIATAAWLIGYVFSPAVRQWSFQVFLWWIGKGPFPWMLWN